MIERSDIQAAMTVAARIVARDGPAFLPIFERLEREVDAMDVRLAALARAQSLTAARRGA